MRKKNLYTTKIYVVLLLVISLFLSSCSFLNDLADELDKIIDIFAGEKAPLAHEGMEVHFIDVGQGDSILIITPSGETMLIDGGDNDKGEIVVDYLKGQGVKKVDYLVGTHPHADHIGGLDDVIDEFDIGEIYMPKVAHTTKTYMDVLEAIDRKGLRITSAKAGMSIPINGVEAQILAPDAQLESSNLNDYSIVIRLIHGEDIFLFQGDAEKKTEDNILASSANIKAHVIKLGHHGSSTSNTEEYIKAVDPKYAVITLGKDNKYGHPHKEVISLMKEMDIKVYRTDIEGDIVAISSGKGVSFNK